MFASSFRRFGAGLALSAVVFLVGCEKPEPLASTTGSISDLVTNVAVRGGYRLVPERVRRALYRKVIATYRG